MIRTPWQCSAILLGAIFLGPSTSYAQMRGKGGGMQRPSGGGMQRPSGGGMQRPSGGGMQRPTGSPNTSGLTRPTPLPQRPQSGLPSTNRPIGSSRPTTLPGSSRPTTLPGSSRPTTLPGSSRPTTLPGLSGRPLPNPDIRPNRPTGPATRPLPGDLDDFLGIHRPIANGRPETLPARRPDLPNRPENRPNWPGNNIGNDINIGNNIAISTRPAWSQRPGVDGVYHSWSNTFLRPSRPIQSWATLPPNRYQYWNSWGTQVRRHWSSHYYSWYGNTWWHHHYHPVGGWHYYWYNTSRPAVYWWNRPTYTAVTAWFTWSAPTQVWQTPVYYDYGTGGNVYYQDDRVYVGGEPIGSREDFAASAADLATVAPPTNEAAAENAEWMPLGTFAVSSDRLEVQPTRSLQLAVSREGIVSGTLYNEATDTAQTVLGQVDPDTQRVALRIGEQEDIVIETGIYNLTQDETPVLVHYGAERSETWLLVRLDAPQDELSEDSPQQPNRRDL